ncbi:hypothetical protein THIOM_001587 [Candidatus Thiomargarita nelsonii]|uniref:Uncharacterized protein n=1 Tax=Candidatus Thiomargarita nelsonii TaxID=1003181 RepID=A0A176S3V1_9GAMM|nr:hypothetical protein THIOM_001587 [Candidatus Thiomargarita nelsonii]
MRLFEILYRFTELLPMNIQRNRCRYHHPFWARGKRNFRGSLFMQDFYRIPRIVESSKGTVY